MEFWFSELQTPNVKLSIRVDRQLYSGKSEFQRIDVFESPEFGRFLTLDGYMMLTEKDEFYLSRNDYPCSDGGSSQCQKGAGHRRRRRRRCPGTDPLPGNRTDRSG